MGTQASEGDVRAGETGTRRIVDLNAARERRFAANESRAQIRESAEDTALLLCSALARSLALEISGLRTLSAQIYAALRGAADWLARFLGLNSMSIPHLLNVRLECCRAYDGQPRAFEAVVRDCFDEDMDAALKMIARIRALDGRLGLPAGDDPSRWNADETESAVRWLRCIEWSMEAGRTTDSLD